MKRFVWSKNHRALSPFPGRASGFINAVRSSCQDEGVGEEHVQNNRNNVMWGKHLTWWKEISHKGINCKKKMRSPKVSQRCLSLAQSWCHHEKKTIYISHNHWGVEPKDPVVHRHLCATWQLSGGGCCSQEKHARASHSSPCRVTWASCDTGVLAQVLFRLVLSLLNGG